MIDGTYILDGYEFGTPSHDVIILSGGLDPGSSSYRVQDTDNPVDDGGWFGRDYLNGPTYQFTLGFRNDFGDVQDTVNRFRTAWRADAVRSTPGALSALTFQQAGKVYRLWGRSRDFALQPTTVADDHWRTGVASFKVATPYVEENQFNQVVVKLLEPIGDGGVTLPADIPFDLDLGSPGSQARQGAAVVGGSAPAHMTVAIKGPTTGSLTGARVYGPGWSIQLQRPVAYDQTVYIDTRREAVYVNGVSTPSMVSARDRLGVQLLPGSQIIGFDGNDPSATATATFGWRNTMPL